MSRSRNQEAAEPSAVVSDSHAVSPTDATNDRQFRLLLEALGDSAHILDTALRFRMANAALLAWHASFNLPVEVVGRPIQEIYPFLPASVWEEYCQVIDTGQIHVSQETTAINGRKVTTETRKIPLLDHGQVTGVVTLMRDLTEQTLAREALWESTEMLQALIHACPLAIETVDPDGIVKIWNPAAERIFGWSKDETVGQRNPLIAVGEDENYRRLRERTLRGESFTGVELTRRRKDGTPVDIRFSTAPIYSHDGTVHGIMATIEDITARKHAEQRLSQLAYYDMLTNLPNRLLCTDRLNQILTRAHRDASLTAVMLLDIDRFKDVNDSLGHTAGDYLLAEVATRLRGCVREGDTVARMGGDEFLLLLPDINSPRNSQVTLHRIFTTFTQPFVIGHQEFTVTPSIGISFAPLDGTTVETLIKHADIAMYQAKGCGRNTYRYFSPELNATLGNAQMGADA